MSEVERLREENAQLRKDVRRLRAHHGNLEACSACDADDEADKRKGTTI